MVSKIKIKAICFFVVIFTALNSGTLWGSPLESLEYNKKKVPIIMYHMITNNQSLLGKFAVTPEEFEQDLAYLKENGYTTVFMSDLIDYVHKEEALPEKPIVLTFDDGDKGALEYGLPLLKKYGMKAVMSVIGEVTDKYTDLNDPHVKRHPHLTWEQIGQLVESGCFEIQSHSYSLHKKNGAKKLKGENREEYKERLSKDLAKLQDKIYENINIRPTTFVYPFGAISSVSDSVLQEIGFSASLSCAEKITVLKKGEQDSLFSIGRFVRPHGVSSEKFFAKRKIN